MVSIYVCDIPQSVEKKELEDLFTQYSGFIECRVTIDKNKDKIAFVDYENEPKAKFAVDHLNGYRFADSKKGILIRMSEHNRSRKAKKNEAENKFIPYSPPHFTEKISTDNFHKMPTPVTTTPINSSFIKENSKSSQSLNPPISALNNQNDYYSSSSNYYNSITKMLNSQSSNYNINPVANFPLQPSPLESSSVKFNTNNPNDVLMNMLSGILNPPLHSPLDSNSTSNHPGLSNEMIQQMKSLNVMGSSFNSQVIDNMSRFYNKYQNIFKPHSNASNTVYVEGIPSDASEREVAHIFRPFPGFKSIRLIRRETKRGEKVVFCFADFENILQSTIVINTLQGYRFDKDDIMGLQFSYATTNTKSKY